MRIADKANEPDEIVGLHIVCSVRATLLVLRSTPRGRAMSETRKIAAILVADVVGYSQLAGVDEGERWRGWGRCAPI
jgi:class 3 adenylate cyclase